MKTLSEWPDPCISDILQEFSSADAPRFVRHLLESGPCDNISKEIRRLGLIIDLADDFTIIDGLEVSLNIGDALIASSSLSDAELSVVHYFLSNAQEGIRRHKRTGWDLYAWEQPELEQQIVHLRSAVRLGAVSGIETVRLCQMYTNLANLLNHCGRVVDALAAWDSALRSDSSFAMALGNRGYGLFGYARLTHDPGHRLYLLREAHDSLQKCLKQNSPDVYGPARETFRLTLKEIEEHVPTEALTREIPEEDFTVEWSDEERGYRTWCLRNRLFLNDLNDIDLDPIAAADVLMLPGITTPLDDPQPSALGFFNQLKQEFASARFTCYEGTRGNEAHFSDRNVILVNTLDYPSYGLALERVKLAYRSAYSIFDKIAYFLNDYLGMSIPSTQVTFRSVWYQRPKNKTLRQGLEDPRNVGLKGLFWLSKDLHESDPSFSAAIEPDAQLLATIRNHLEHKYLKLHEWSVPGTSAPSAIGFEVLAYSLTRSDFLAKTLRLLRLVRAALIYLVQAVYAEEHRRKLSKDDKFVAPMFLDTYEDAWKF